MVWLSGLALVTTLVYTGIHAAHGGVAHLAGAGGSFNWAGFLGMASVVGVWQLSYAPYVSDYSRYLPSSTSTRAAFWYTYGGTVLGVIERCPSVPSWSPDSARTAGWGAWTASCRTPCSSS